MTERPPTPASLLDPTEPGRLKIVTSGGVVSAPLTGLAPNVGLLDVKLDPQFASNKRVYVSFMERDPSATRIGLNAANPGVQPAGMGIMRFTLAVEGNVGTVSDVRVIWRQNPKIVSRPGSGEPGGRMAFSPDGYLFITSGDRQELEFELLFRTDNNLGKIVRMRPDGTEAEIWTLGHRNQYGLAFNSAGELWEHEMGPIGGDEMNLVARGANYGWPKVSYGDHDGALITKPAAGDDFATSPLTWTPTIAPSDMIFYSGSLFEDWKGDAIISGLRLKGLVRVRLSGSGQSTTAKEMQRIDLGARIRAVSQGPDGAIWVLEDGTSGRLLKLAPVFQ